MATFPRSPSCWVASRVSSPPVDSNAPAIVIFPPQTHSTIESSLGPGSLTVKLHSATRMGSASCPGAVDGKSLYAILDCEGFQQSARADLWDEQRGVALWEKAIHLFDVTTSPELAVHLFARTHKDLSERYDGPRGRFAIASRQHGFPVGKILVDNQNGTGQMEIEVSYLKQKMTSLEDRKIWAPLQVNHSKFALIKKWDTGRTYALTSVQLGAGTVTELQKANDLGSSLCHPYIAPLKFAFASGAQLRLLSPFASGGYLLHHLQKERRFNVDKARLYAAELVLALEYLHSRNMCAALDPAQVLLDAYGHISLCDPAIYSQGFTASSISGCAPPTCTEYTAPELLAGQEATTAIDWWVLGVFLHEMLTGLPPFYHRDVEEQQHRIVKHALQVPLGLPSHAGTILATLLLKDPLHRLGARGASEVKAHPFFHGLDWQRLYQRDLPSQFRPEKTSFLFRLQPIERKLEKRPSRRLSNDILYEFRSFEGAGLEGFGISNPTFWEHVGCVMPKVDHATDHATDHDAWSLSWDSSTARLYLSHQLTGEELSVNVDHPVRPSTAYEHNATAASQTEPGRHTNSLPSAEQLVMALKVSLRDGHGNSVIAQIIKYGVNLDTSILKYDHVPDDTGIKFLQEMEIPVTPLEWATEHGRLDLVNLFLENGADANYTCHETYGPALVRAVYRSPQIVPLLVGKTNRVASTRALCAAVDRQDATIVKTLLTNGVRCEFEEKDLPLPIDYRHNEQAYPILPGPRLEAVDFLAPLVRAVRLGNAELVQLLLAHGADANVGYHCDNDGWFPIPHRQLGWEEEHLPRVVNFSCGRAVQLAMDLGHDEIVRLLIRNGADVRLPRPLWAPKDHTCRPVPRAAWLEVISRLDDLSLEVGLIT